MNEALEPRYPSLTPNAVQIRWKVPTEFPSCPERSLESSLERYAERLVFGSVFARNHYTTSSVVHRAEGSGGIVVLTRFTTEAIKDWAVAVVRQEGEIFVHRSEFTFFTLQGALKHFCVLTGESFDDTIDDYAG